MLIGPAGAVLGSYRKTHVFYLEDRRAGGWVTRGDQAVVVDTELAAIGLLICYDGDFPELARAEAVLGAEVLCRPSALLRSADIWELTNRARAYDNHVFVVGANATGSDPAGMLYFGNSMIVSPVAEVVARATSHQGWCSARLDPATAMATVTPGSSVPQRFDHLADRNLALVERHLDDLRRPARDPVPAPAARAMTAPRRIRVGVDTGGTFTDVVAFDEDTGELAATKTPSTPADPAEGFMDGIAKVLAVLGVGAEAVTAVCHGTTVATNQLLEGKVGRLGFVTTEGFGALLEIARQSVPDGYGNSYFWVKPPRIVPADLVRTVGGRLDHTGAELRPFDEDQARAAARFLPRPGGGRGRGLLPARLRQPGPRAAHARDPGRRAPRGRGLDLQRGAARVPRVRAGHDHPGRRRRQAAGRPLRRHHRRTAWTPWPRAGPCRST